MERADQTNRPEKGSHWRNDSLRGTWRVKSVGPKYVTLVGMFGNSRPLQVDRVMWPGAWRRDAR